MAAVNETMAEGLKKLMSAIAQLMVLPDADLEFLTGLQGTITGFLRSQAEGTAQQAANIGGGGGMGGMEMAGMGGGGMGAPGAGGLGGGMQGLMASPNPDELRRLLSAGSAGG